MTVTAMMGTNEYISVVNRGGLAVTGLFVAMATHRGTEHGKRSPVVYGKEGENQNETTLWEEAVIHQDQNLTPQEHFLPLCSQQGLGPPLTLPLLLSLTPPPQHYMLH